MATKFAAATAFTLTLKKASLSPDCRGGSCLTGNSPPIYSRASSYPYEVEDITNLRGLSV